MRRGYLKATMLASCRLLGACASPRGSTGLASTEPITRAELVVGRFTTAMDAVIELRPGWTRNLVGVYVNAQRGSVDDLRAIPIQAVVEIALISADEAVTKYGARLISGNLLEIRTGS